MVVLQLTQWYGACCNTWHPVWHPVLKHFLKTTCVCGTSKPDENQADRDVPFRWNQLWLPFLSNKGNMINYAKSVATGPGLPYLFLPKWPLKVGEGFQCLIHIPGESHTSVQTKWNPRVCTAWHVTCALLNSWYSFANMIFTPDMHMRSLQTFKFRRIPLCLCIRKTLSGIIGQLA